jgi:DNA-binding cell septation regulator SpoVG
MNSTRYSDEFQARLKLSPAVIVDSIKRIDGTGALKGFATVTIAGKLTIHSCRIIHAPGQSAWVSLPQTEVKAADGGKSKFYPIVEIHDENLKRAIETAVLAEFRKLESMKGN